MRCTAIAVLIFGLTGCRYWGHKAKPDQAPLPVLPPPSEVKAQPVKVEAPGPPPKIETKAPEVPSTVAEIPKPPAPKPKRRQPRKVPAVTGTAAQQQAVVKDPVAVPPPNAEQTPAPQLATVPKLGEILSDDQRVQLLRICDESIGRAKDALTQLRGLSLSADQRQSMTRVRLFIAQAEKARQKDPQTAKQLAERADLLSRDLVRTVR